MPARQSGRFHCFCIICITSCATGPDGTPLGNSIPESQRISHLARAKAEAEAQRQSQESELQNAAVSLFASALVDDGPNPHAQPSRLWSSREEYQDSVSKLSPESDPLPVDTIIQSFQRLQDSTPVSPMSQSQSSFPSESEALPLNAVIESLRSLELDDQEQSAPSTLSDVDMMETSAMTPSIQGASKRERSHLTKTAHSILDYVENQTRHWLFQLADVASGDTLAGAEADIGHIQTVFDNVKRNVRSVDVRKARIAPKMFQLQARLVELRCLYPYVDDKPLQFDSDHHYNMSIDLYAPVAQLTMFIVVVCSVMMGVSRRLGDLLLGLLTITLRCAFLVKSTALSSRQQSILDQIPHTMDTVLSKFNLEQDQS